MTETSYAALLRGINLGPTRRVEMARLRALAERLGYTGVRTHLQSGNLLLRTAHPEPAVAAELHRAISAEFGFSVPVVVRSHQELADVAAADPLAQVAADPARYLVTFLSEAPKPDAVTALLADHPDATVSDGETAQLIGRELYTWSPNGVQASRFGLKDLERRLGVTGTARNWKTVLRLRDLTA